MNLTHRILFYKTILPDTMLQKRHNIQKKNTANCNSNLQ